MPKIAQAEAGREASASGRNLANLAEVTRETREKAADAAHEGERLVRATADAAAEQRETARHSAETTAEAGRMFMDMLTEQAQHNMQAAAALSRAVDWSQVAEIQRDFFSGSFARASQLAHFYRQIFQVGTSPTRFGSRH